MKGCISIISVQQPCKFKDSIGIIDIHIAIVQNEHKNEELRPTDCHLSDEKCPSQGENALITEIPVLLIFVCQDKFDDIMPTKIKTD